MDQITVELGKRIVVTLKRHRFFAGSRNGSRGGSAPQDDQSDGALGASRRRQAITRAPCKFVFLFIYCFQSSVGENQ
jgi:hypothetical protein